MIPPFCGRISYPFKYVDTSYICRAHGGSTIGQKVREKTLMRDTGVWPYNRRLASSQKQGPYTSDNKDFLRSDLAFMQKVQCGKKPRTQD